MSNGFGLSQDLGHDLVASERETWLSTVILELVGDNHLQRQAGSTSCDWQVALSPICIATNQTDNSLNYVGGLSMKMTFRTGIFALAFLILGSTPATPIVLTITDFTTESADNLGNHAAGFQITITSSGDTLNDIATGGGSSGPDDFYFELSSTSYADGNWKLTDVELVNPSSTLGAGLESHSDTSVVVQLGAVASAWSGDPVQLIEKVNNQAADTGLSIDHYEFVGFDAGISSLTIETVPEPATALFAGLAIGFVAFWRQRPF